MKWHTEKRKLKDLHPFESNPRQLSEKQYNELKKSLEKFNLAEIPAINTDNKICAGHQRLKILHELYGKDYEIDVRVPDRKLTDKEFKEYNIRSNKNIGDWDFDILANDFEIDLLKDIGFEDFELGLGIETDFPELKDGDREPFQQMTFTLADEQAEFIKQCMSEVEIQKETFNNENSNGNKLYSIAVQWAERKT